MPYEYSWEQYFYSEPVKVNGIVHEILHFLDEFALNQTPDERWELKLIFNELLFNAVIHGNASDKQKQVHVIIKVSDHLVNASITDEGNGYDYQRIVAQAQPSADDFQKETGRGMRLVLALTDRVIFSQNGRRVTFDKQIGKCHG